jgi:hypothetical protein
VSNAPRAAFWHVQLMQDALRTQRKRRPALHLDALTLVSRLHLLALCQLAVQMARHRCPPPLLAGPGGRPRRYSEESLLLLALLRTLWR